MSARTFSLRLPARHRLESEGAAVEPAKPLQIASSSSLYLPRTLRRHGLAGYEPETLGCFLAAVELAPPGSVFRPLAMPQLIEARFQEILVKAETIKNPFEQAFFAMVHLPYLQPFEDVNKRVSRLAANIPLFKNNLAPLSFVDIPIRSYVDAVLGVYELRRVELLRDSGGVPLLTSDVRGAKGCVSVQDQLCQDLIRKGGCQSEQLNVERPIVKRVAGGI